MEVDKDLPHLKKVIDAVGENINKGNGQCSTNTAFNNAASVIDEVKKEYQNEGETGNLLETNCMEFDETILFIKREEPFMKHDEIKEESCMQPTPQPIVVFEPALRNTDSVEVTPNAHDKVYPKSFTKETIYKCVICSYEGTHKRYLKQHMLCHWKVKKFECDKCSYQSPYKNNLIRHTLTHKTSETSDEDVEWYNCEICPFKTKYKRNIKSHMVCHLDIEMLECDVCSYKTKRRSCLTQHKLTHKSTSEVPMYVCQTCSYQTRYKVTMELHVLSHKKSSDNQMYECDICHFKGKNKQYLRHHMLSHKRHLQETAFRRLQTGNQLINLS